MKPSRRSGLFVLFFVIHLASHAQQSGTAPWPGSGVMIAGQLWDSFLPPNAGPWYGEKGAPLVSTFMRIGNFDRAWSTPTHMWPGGWPYGMFWSKGMSLTEFNPDSAWNPLAIAGAPNPARHPQAGPSYAFGSYAPGLLGASDPERNFTRETRWVDLTRRSHALYEAGWPTNIGIDVTVGIHQFTLNWNNFNDFILVEIVLKNTGVLDLNADGVADSIQTGRPGRNRIRALALMANGEMFCSYYLNRSGGRSSRLGSSRGCGYVGDLDRTGSPWDMMVAFPGESVEGLRDMGLYDWPDRDYADVWSSWAWIAAKSGAGPSQNVHSLPEKLTIYGTRGIGSGSERGWYASAGQGKNLRIGDGGISRNPGRIHTVSIGTWYRDGGRSRDSLLLDLSPDPNFFSAGTPGDPTTFVPAPSPRRPEGDRKLLQVRDVNPYEPSWMKGFTGVNNFDGDLYSGIGPFSLEPGESMTLVWAEGGGFRFAGAANTIAAARWAFDHGFTVPEPPSAPQVRVENTLGNAMRVRWDNRAESEPGFQGYKIYRACLATPVDWLHGGMRSMDRYWESTAPGPVPDSLMQPVNPSFNAFDFVQGRTGTPGPWGPYQLVAMIPKSSLGAYASAGSSGMAYAWDDRNADPGYAYWYTVAASAAASVDLGAGYGGTNAVRVSRLETSNLNRNGAEGLWKGVYPFADLHPLFPATPDGRRAIGAGIVFTSAMPDAGDLTSGSARVLVRPNPYKKKAIWDNPGSSVAGGVMFSNLPPGAVITIMDVSGQVMQRLEFASSDGESGSMMWNCVSKDGYEVASGLYVYVVEFNGGRQVGYLSVLR
jgi:hypothetical protein